MILQSQVTSLPKTEYSTNLPILEMTFNPCLVREHRINIDFFPLSFPSSPPGGSETCTFVGFLP